MFNDLRVRLATILGLVLLSAWVLYDRGITLGLDLQGGINLAYQISDPSGALDAAGRAEAVDRALTVIRTRVDELGVAEPGIQKQGDDKIVVELPGATDEQQQRAKDIIERTAFLQFQIVEPASDLAPALSRIDRAIIASGAATPAPGTAAAPGDTTATADLGLFSAADSTAPDSARADSASAPVAQRDSTAGAQPFSSLIQPASASDEGIFMVAAADVPKIDSYLRLPQVQEALPRQRVLRWGRQDPNIPADYRVLYLLNSERLIDGTYLEDAQAQRDERMQPIVNFQFDRRGGRIFGRGTGANVGRLMAIVLDETVVSAPILQAQIFDRGQITLGGGSIEEAGDLALVLRAGALEAPIEMIEQRSIGPSLGQDSIDRGKLAGIIGTVLVVVLMIGYYRFSGVMAVSALMLYVLFILGAMAAIGAALTLPGIAGLILSIGMALDANVLIFERIREELEAGRTPRVATSEGFGHAFSAIIDSHATTLLTAFVLYQFGTGPVRGFGVTLAIGIIASLFTAVFVTRTFFMIYLDRRPTAETISI